MTAAGAQGDDILELVAARQGHFRLESGHHSTLWLDLDTLFAQPARIRPLVDRLAQALQPYELQGICGPLVGGAFLAQAVASTLAVEFCFTERVMPAERDGMHRARYRLPRGLRDRVAGKRFAIVDDVISAGSAAGGSYAELQAHGAHPEVVGALLVLGSVGRNFFSELGVSVEALAQLPYELWVPEECPSCASGTPLEDVASDTDR
ncbi:MAG: orotate phosphoribosyltransferase [Gemmatimonadales bacterium]